MLILASAVANAQCVPDANLSSMAPGVYPPAGTVVNGATFTFPPITVNQPANLRTDVKVLTDTTLSFFGLTFTVPIDSMIITSVVGMPPGLTYVCNNTACAWKGGDIGCIEVQGTPTQIGTFSVNVNTLFTVNVPGLIDTSAPAPFVFEIEVSSGVSIFEERSLDFRLSPNPAHQYVNIAINRQNENVGYRIEDLSGRLVEAGSFIPELGEYRLKTGHLNNGLYLLQLESRGHTVGQRLLIAH